MMMNRNKNDLDEMQQGRRGIIGNQMFWVLYWAIFLNGALHGDGITWLDYPYDVFVILFACMTVYLVRLSLSGSYLSEKVQSGKNWIVEITITVMLTFGVMFIVRRRFIMTDEPWSDGATISGIVLAVGAIITLTSIIVRKVRDRED